MSTSQEHLDKAEVEPHPLFESTKTIYSFSKDTIKAELNRLKDANNTTTNTNN